MKSPAEKHMGFLVRWAERAVRSQWFERWTWEDILSEAFIRADFLLREKYNPKKGTPTIFLGSCLRTDLSYAYQRSLGKTIHWVKKEDGGRKRTWVQKSASVDCLDAIAPGTPFDFNMPVDFSEIELTIRERKIISMLMANYDRPYIANRLGIGISRVGQIINESIRPKIRDWIKGVPTREPDRPESGMQKDTF